MSLPVHNPATGELLAEVPALGTEEANQAVNAAARALEIGASLAERSNWLRGIAEGLLEGREEMARLITQEQGKPLAEARVEVDYAAGFFRFYAEELHHLEPRPLPQPIRDVPWTIHHRPAGVAALITPWNFPLAMLAKKLAPALGAGCASVIKPAELTPLCAIALCHIATAAGVPAGRINLLTGPPSPIGKALCEHPLVRVISFTGSTATGKILLRDSAPHIKRLALELGGNAPFIVFADADLEAAADALMANKFRCAGQTCVCANRVYVEAPVAAKFEALVCERVAALKMGNGMEDGVDIGPLINRAAWEKVERHVREAEQAGARRAFGAAATPPENEWGCYYPPVVLGGVRDAMAVFREETFGPVVAIATFNYKGEVVGRANGTPHGLAAYLFNADAEKARWVAAHLQFGHVGINTGTGPTPEAPFGGMKQSGLGREGGLEGLFEFTETQTVAGS